VESGQEESIKLLFNRGVNYQEGTGFGGELTKRALTNHRVVYMLLKHRFPDPRIKLVA
jgi:hypothetical protein